MYKGKFIVFEGLDGAGTTTQSQLLYNVLNKQEIPSVLTFEPSNGDIGKLIRRFLAKEIDFNETTMALLFAADRSDHINKTVIPSLQAGINVISDRYVISSYAYQSLGENPDFIKNVNNFIIVPDLTIYLRILPENALKRKNNEFSDYYERLDFQKKVYDYYEKYVNEYQSEHNIATISGDLSIEDVHSQVVKLVENYIT